MSELTRDEIKAMMERAEASNINLPEHCWEDAEHEFARTVYADFSRLCAALLAAMDRNDDLLKTINHLIEWIEQGEHPMRVSSKTICMVARGAMDRIETLEGEK